jgi:hypothetical protein
MREDDGDVSLDDMITIEQVAKELWQKGTKRTDADWEALSVLAKQSWRHRARMEVTIWRKKVSQP